MRQHIKLTLSRFPHSKLAFLCVFLLLMFLLPRLLSWLSATDYQPGAVPSGLFQVAVSSHTGKPFELVSLQEARSPALAGRTLWTQAARFSEGGGIREAEVRIVAQSPQGTLIETIDSDDDLTLTSRYRVTAGRIEPVSLQTFSPGHVMSGILLAIALSKLLFFVLHTLKPLSMSQANAPQEKP
ncbi:hypothetical protein [Leeia aquatica]|uniref:Uncharacterized protein n=1 Tax=Leeia aquatica TaxID=2725557 RepID=A0A847RSH5_9NEIS|nr:hypothetical protein [Leeia aquatica]NLR74160.1 hypothetical protein [Leeia aquatica]